LRLRISTFTLLRNVSITVEGYDKRHRPLLERFEREFARLIGSVDAHPSPMAVSFVLVSTAMIVAPLALMSNRMPEMVRLITDLVH
jgi:hypothetical protein